MAPIVVGLLAQGLNLIANAVMAKGREYVEEKTGVKLTDGSLPPEALERLKQYELENEIELTKLRQEANRLDAELFKIEVDEKDSARKRDMAFIVGGMVNWRSNIMFAMAVCIIIWLVYIIWQTQELNEYVKGIFTLVLGRFLGYLDNIYNFEFGTTRTSRTKDNTIQNLSKGGQP